MVTDVIVLLRQVGPSGPNSQERSASVRAAITIASLVPEAAANALLSHETWGPLQTRQLDRLEMIPKFCLYLELHHPAQKLDKNDSRVKALQEVHEMRGSLVHRKRRKVQLPHAADGTARPAPTPPYPALGISRNPSDWQFTDAVVVLRAVADFLNYVLADLCNQGGVGATHLLGTSFEYDWGFEPQDRSTAINNPVFDYAIDTLRVDLGFLGAVRHP